MYFTVALLTLCVTLVIVAGEHEDCRRDTIEYHCHDKETRWYYDRKDRDCRRFRGCAGRGNNFRTKDDCEDKCEDKDDHDGCRGKVCNDCERCIRGRCVRVVFPNFWCRGRIPSFEEIRAEQIPVQLPVQIPVQLPVQIPVIPPVVDLCQNINCGVCQRCRFGQCINIDGCIPPDPCFNINCGTCQQCQVGQCVNVAGCTPPDPCFNINCGRCQQCDSSLGYASCVNNPSCFIAGPPSDTPVFPVAPPVDGCAGVACPECFTCSSGQCVGRIGCIAFRLGRCFGACGPCHVCTNGWCVPRRNGFCDWRSGHDAVFGRFPRR